MSSYNTIDNAISFVQQSFSVSAKDQSVIKYDGHQLPRDKVEYVKPAFDYTNNPSSILLSGFALPPDTQITVNGQKTLASSDILDGPAVFERISNKPIEIEFEGTIREQHYMVSSVNNDYIHWFVKPGPFIFPQTVINKIWTQLWEPNAILKVQNTYLNGIGIMEVIVNQISQSTVRGNTNVPFKLHCYVNTPGMSLIVDEKNTSSATAK